MKTLPNRSIMVQFLLLKTTDLAIGEYIVMKHTNLNDCQFEAFPANGQLCNQRIVDEENVNLQVQFWQWP